MMRQTPASPLGAGWNAGAAIGLILAVALSAPSRVAAQAVPSALLPGPTEFRRSDVQSRRGVVRALAHGSPDQAGAPLLPLVEAALLDPDKDVRHYAVGVLQRVASEANRARVTNKPVATNLASYPALYQTLLRMIDHPDTILRAGIVSALPAFAVGQNDALDSVLASRLVAEVPYVRARIVTALADRAMAGSVKARSAVLASLDDSSLGVRVSAMKAMRSLRAPEALPALMREMASAEAPDVRRMAVQVLGSYGDGAQASLSAIAAQRTREANPVVRAELERLVDQLERSGRTPR